LKSTPERPAGQRLWGGAFEGAVDPVIDAFTRSFPFDRRLAVSDLVGSLAHARMLFETGVLDRASSASVLEGLSSLLRRVESGELVVDGPDEDVHTWIERKLTDEVGDAGRRLHTARSRNDQTAVALRLWQRRAVERAVLAAVGLVEVLLRRAREEVDTVLPGYTHTQRAQPTTLAHHLLAHAWSVLADAGRLRRAHGAAGLSPLGAGAMAGSPHAIDPHRSADLLGFDGACPNSMWAVADRDYAAEALFACALAMVHLSRWADEVVLWTSSEFGFARLQDRAAKGSSIMPQKKNPDVPELVRGKSGRVVGHLLSLLTLMKSQPLAYNKDNQEDKEPIFDTLDTLKDCVFAFSELVPAIECRREAMREAAGANYATATDLADYLVRKGLPFRDAHGVTGKAVAHAIGQGKELAELSLPELRSFSGLIEADAYEVLSVEGSVAARNHPGGTAPTRVRQAAAAARKALAAQASAQRDAGASSSIS